MRAEHPTLSRLRSVAPFDRCSTRVLRALAPHVDHLCVAEGTTLTREGREAREFIVVLSGDVVATRRGREVAIDTAGAQLGGAALVDHQPHDSTWVARSDLEVLVVNGPAFRWIAQTTRRSAAA